MPTDLADRQAFAAVGQSRLVNLYQQALSHKSIVVGQILLTQQDFCQPERLWNLPISKPRREGGGMGTKLRAAGMAQGAGCHVVIAPGRAAGVLKAVLACEPIGSWVPAIET